MHSNELTSVVINKAFNLAFPTMDKSDIKDFKLHYCPKTEPGSIPIPMCKKLIFVFLIFYTFLLIFQANSKKTKGKQEQKESNIVDIDSSKMTYFSGYPLKSSEKLIATLDIGKGFFFFF